MSSIPSRPRSSRRGFLKAFGAGAAALGLPSATWARPPAIGRPDQPGRARNVIFLVSDGMSLGTLSLAEQFRRRREGRGTAWLGLYADPRVRRALMDTASASALLTDSAAAGSAWGGGLRVANGSLNVGPGGERPTPILQAARNHGRATGLVTTATITHATPASFVINHPARQEQDAIAELYATSGFDLLLGGGARHFDPAQRPDARDLWAEMRGQGYQVARTKAELSALAGTAARVIGVFADGYQPYALDHANAPELGASHPTLAEMARFALRQLAARGGDRGFFVQIEAARVDHAAHANDFGGLIHDQLEFDEVVAAVRAFTADRDDTLVIVATDHGNANPGLNGPDKAFERSFTFTRTNHWIMSELTAESTAMAIRERVYLATSLALTDEEITHLQAALRGDYRTAYRRMQSPIVVLGQLLANHIAIGWNGVAHTADLCEVAAYGPGSEILPPLILNTDLHALMCRAAEV
jgi:alkaline phosphatase